MARKAPTKAPSRAAPKATKTRARKPAGRKVTPPVAAASPGDPVAIPPPEVIVVRSRRVACEGVGGALGHPRVYLEMGEADFVECGYCDRRFVLATGTEGPENELTAPGVYEGSHGH